eukprot:COSAG01_NODE_25878_length_730_cov_1.153724_1_plen_65_part_10
MSQNAHLLGRRARRVPANASAVATHRDPMSRPLLTAGDRTIAARNARRFEEGGLSAAAAAAIIVG